MDGTPLIDLGGAKIYYGTNSYNYTHVIDVGMVTNYTITNLELGKKYYFNGVAYNTAGLESDFTIEVSKIPSIKPSAPINLIIR